MTALPLPSPASQPLIEPLSQRELEVLRLFKTELSGPEIARELVIGLSTVRTHTKSIYSKLNVNNRRAAVKRCRRAGFDIAIYPGARTVPTALTGITSALHAGHVFWLGYCLLSDTSPHTKSPHVGKTSPHIHLYIVFSRTKQAAMPGVKL